MCKTDPIEEKVLFCNSSCSIYVLLDRVKCFDHVRSYDNPFQQTDNHVKLYQKPCARVNSSFAILGVKKLEF